MGKADRGTDWSIVFFDEDGEDPIRRFLDGLDRKTQARFAWSIEQLRVRNINAREPLVRHVEGKIWELREESRTNIYRVLYCTTRVRRIVLLHGFQKKTAKAPRREIETAWRRMNEFLASE